MECAPPLHESIARSLSIHCEVGNYRMPPRSRGFPTVEGMNRRRGPLKIAPGRSVYASKRTSSIVANCLSYLEFSAMSAR
jgi:hypothetical protein